MLRGRCCESSVGEDMVKISAEPRPVLQPTAYFPGSISAEPRPVLQPTAYFPSSADPIDELAKTMKQEFRDMKKSHMRLEEAFRERLEMLEASLNNAAEMLRHGVTINGAGTNGTSQPKSPQSGGRTGSMVMPYEYNNTNGAAGRVSTPASAREGETDITFQGKLQLNYAAKLEQRGLKRRSQQVDKAITGQASEANGIKPKPTAKKDTEALKVVRAQGALNKEKSLKFDENSILAPIVRHPWFDSIIACVVVASAVLVGLQINYDAVRHKEYAPYTYIEYCCTCIFSIELLMRFIALKRHFCDSSIRIWACFDVTLVFISWVDVGMKLLAQGDSLPGPGASIAKIIKMARMARIVRILRMVKWLAKVRIMSTMIVGSMTSLFWLFVLIMGVMYLFALILTQGCTDWVRPNEGAPPLGHEDYDYMKESYGTVLRSIYTLFLAMTGGVSWGEPAALTKEMGFLHWFVFSFFIFFTFFSVLNIVTGVFVDGAIQQANSDRSIRLMQQHAQNKEYTESLMEVLNHLDCDESGYITKEEWAQVTADENVHAHMLLLGVNADDAERLFKLLDTGCDGVISIEEFVQGMSRLRGPAQSMDLHMLISRVNFLIAETELFFAGTPVGAAAKPAIGNGRKSMMPPKGGHTMNTV